MSYALRESTRTEMPWAAFEGKRIAIVGRLIQPGGVQSVIISTIKGLNRHGIIPDIVWDLAPNQQMMAEKGIQANYQPVKFPIHSLTLDKMPISARYLLRTADYFTSSQLPAPYDFYYIFSNVFEVTDNSPHVRYLSGPPLLPQLDITPPGVRGIPIRIFRWLYSAWLCEKRPIYEFHSDSNYVINSNYTAQLFKEAHGVELPVVHPPINLSGRSFSPEDISQRDTMTYFSRYAPHKRPEMVIELAARHPEKRFVLMGGVSIETRAYYEQLKQMAANKQLHNITFYDNPSDEKVKEELARTRFFIFTAINEHFGMATAEAIGSGAIPFVHDSGGQREIVPDVRLRFTDERFYAQFAQLLDMPEEVLNAIRASLREHVERFSEDEFIHKMISFIGTAEESEDMV